MAIKQTNTQTERQRGGKSYVVSGPIKQSKAQKRSKNTISQTDQHAGKRRYIQMDNKLTDRWTRKMIYVAKNKQTDELTNKHRPRKREIQSNKQINGQTEIEKRDRQAKILKTKIQIVKETHDKETNRQEHMTKIYKDKVTERKRKKLTKRQAQKHIDKVIDPRTNIHKTEKETYR